MLKRSLIILFLNIFQFFLIITFLAQPAQAAPNDLPNWTMPEPKLQIPIDTIKFSAPQRCGGTDQNPVYCVGWIGQYIVGIYQYAIGIVGILAAVVLMFGGLIWLTAGGNATQIGNAKAWIGASLTGLVIALCSYMILYLVNPDLTIFRPLQITLPKKMPEVVGGAPKNCDWKIPQNVDTQGNFTTEQCSVYNLKKYDDSLCTKPKADVSATYVCCCQELGGTDMCKANASYPQYCDACQDCAEVKISGLFCKENPCLVNIELYNKLTSLYAVNQDWMITEPWPPTVPHGEPCHKNGTCVDIALSFQARTGDVCSYVNKLIADLKSAGINNIKNEYKNCGGTVYGTTTGDNIHISL